MPDPGQAELVKSPAVIPPDADNSPTDSDPPIPPIEAGTTRRRWSTRRKHSTQKKRPTAGFKRDVAVLKASGMTVAGMARTLEVSPLTIKKVQRLPEVQQGVFELRQNWKALAHAKIEAMADATWSMANGFVQQRDSKQFDNTMRGLSAMEKISQSVSGEGQKVEVSGMVQGPPQVELKALVAQIFGGARR